MRRKKYDNQADCTGLDGTLLTSEKTIDPLTKEKLQEAMKMGSSYCYCDRKG